MGQCGYARPGKPGGIPKPLPRAPPTTEPPHPPIDDVIDQVILSSFAVDALCLSSHWEYRVTRIEEALGGQVTKFLPPRLHSYFQDKEAGDQSPEGDSAFYLLYHIGEDRTFDLHKWGQHWRFQWTNSETQKDHATKDTLAAMDDDVQIPKCASETQLDLGPVARIFPLLALNYDEQKFVDACIEQASLTHSQEHVKLCTEYHARLLHRVIYQRMKPSAALASMAYNNATPQWIRECIGMAMESKNDDDWEALTKWGEFKVVGAPHDEFKVYSAQSDMEYGYPLVLHFIFKYESHHEPLNAVIRNIAMGGMTATRGMMIASILYAYHLTQGNITLPSSEDNFSALTSSRLSTDPDIHELIPQLTHYQTMMGYIQTLRGVREGKQKQKKTKQGREAESESEAEAEPNKKKTVMSSHSS